MSGLVAGLVVLNLVVLVALMLLRARYPFELEWIESASLSSSHWILAGHPLHGRPQLEFVPLLYTPLYFYASAVALALAGPGFLGPRLVSVAATLATGWLMIALVRHETGRTWPGVIGAGFYAATFRVTGVWFDVARADSLLLCLLLLAAFVTRRYPGRRGALACAAILSLAYLTKQSALPFFVAIGLYYLLEPRREWLVFWPAASGLLFSMAWAFNAITHGWYNFYTWYLVRQTVLDAARIRAFWLTDMFGHVPLALAAGIIGLSQLGSPLARSAAGSRSRFYWIMTVGAITASWWNRSAAGAYTNTLMPVMAWLGVLIGLALSAWLSRPKFHSVAWLILAAQFVALLYDPRAVLPRRLDEQAGQNFIAQLRAYPGDVFIPAHSAYAALAGKPTFAHWAAITDASGLWDTNLDVQRGGTNDPRRAIILDEIRAAIAIRRFSAVILDKNDEESTAYWNDLLGPYYHQAGQVFADPSVFWTVSGAASRPQLIYLPNE